MFDLNRPPSPVQGEVSPAETKEKPMNLANSATLAAPNTFASSSKNYKFVPSELAHLLIMVQELPNDLPDSSNLRDSPNIVCLNSNQATLPPHTSAFFKAPATARIGSTSGAAPAHAAHLATCGVGNGVPSDVTVMPSKHERVVEERSRDGASGGLRENYNPVSECQTTMLSEGESDICKPPYSRDNSNSKAPVVDFDSLLDEIQVEPEFPWSPVEQEEAATHITVSPMSTKSPQVSPATVTMRPPISVEEKLQLREVAFNASFKLETHRCTPVARCRRCLAFCQRSLSQLPLPSLEGSSSPGGGSQEREESPPVLRNAQGDEDRQLKKQSRHGPKSKSSEYHGVTFYKRTGRWEAHIWHEGAQVYLGASKTKEGAARVYDQAALLLLGPEVELNLKSESYKIEMAYLHKLTKEQLVLYLRRDSRGFRAQVPYPGVKLVKNLYEANYGPRLLGTFAIEEDAARAVFKEAIRNSSGGLVDLILDTHHVRNMPSYATQRFAALHPEAVEGTQVSNQAKPIASDGPSVAERASSPQNMKLLTRRATMANHELNTSPAAAASPIAASPHPGAVEQLPRNKFDGNVESESRGAFATTHCWDSYLAPKTLHRHAASITPVTPHHLQSLPHPQQLANMLPKVVRPLAAVAVEAPTAASSSCGVPSSAEASSSRVVQFKLFNVEISVVVDSGHGGERAEAHGKSEPQFDEQVVWSPRKRRKSAGKEKERAPE